MFFFFQFALQYLFVVAWFLVEMLVAVLKRHWLLLCDYFAQFIGDRTYVLPFVCFQFNIYF